MSGIGSTEKEILEYMEMSPEEQESVKQDRFEELTQQDGFSEEKAKKIIDFEVSKLQERGVDVKQIKQREKDIEARSQQLEQERERKKQEQEAKDAQKESFSKIFGNQEPKKQEDAPKKSFFGIFNKPKEERKKETLIWSGNKVKNEDEDEIPDEYKGRKLKELEPIKKEKEEQENIDDYTETKEKISSGIDDIEAIGRGLTGFGSRRPLKEAIVSAASKTIEVLKGKPLTKTEIRRKEEIEEAKHKAKVEALKHPKQTTSKYIPSSHVERREPSLKDLGRGDMGTKRYETTRDPVGFRQSSKTPDFFGTGTFQIGTGNPLGSPLGNPVGSNPLGAPIRNKSRPPSTIIRGKPKPPSVSFPKNKQKHKPIKKKYFKQKTKQKQKNIVRYKKPRTKDAVDVLGLRGFTF